MSQLLALCINLKKINTSMNCSLWEGVQTVNCFWEMSGLEIMQLTYFKNQDALRYDTDHTKIFRYFKLLQVYS